MKFAIASDGSEVASHFGRCECYEVIEVTDGQVTDRYQLENPGHEPGQLPKLLKNEGAGCIVAGGMGPRAQQFCAQMQMAMILGVSGLLDEVISQIAADELVAGEDQCVH